MKKLLLILLCLPMIGFGQSCKSLELDLNDQIVPQYPLVSGSPVPLEFSAEFTIEFWIKTQHNLQNAAKILYKDNQTAIYNYIESK